MTGGADFRETDVTYKAKADFSDLLGKVAAAQAAISALRAAEKAANADSANENKDVAASQNSITNALNKRIAAQKKLNDLESGASHVGGSSSGSAGGASTSGLNAVDDAQKRVSASREKLVKDTQDLNKAETDLSKVESDLSASRKKADAAGTDSANNRLAIERKIFGAIERSAMASNTQSRSQSNADSSHLSGLRAIEAATSSVGRAETVVRDAGVAGDRARADGIKAITSGLQDERRATSDLGSEASRTDSRLKGIFSTIAGISSRLGAFGNSLPEGRGGLILGGLSSIPALLPVISSVLAIIPAAVAGLGALGAGAMAFASNLSTLAAGLVAIVPLAAGAATMFGVLKIALDGVTGTTGALALYAKWQDLIAKGATPLQIANAAKAYQAAFGALAPAAQQFVKWQESISGAFGHIANAVQQNFFAGFVKDLGLVNHLLAPLGALLENTATAMGKVADLVLKAFAGPEWVAAINALSTALIPLIGTIGKTLVSTLGLFRELTLAALPFTIKMVDGLNSIVVSLVNMLDTPGRAAQFTAFLNVVYGRLLVWLDILKNIGLVFARFSSAASGWSDNIVKNFDKVTASWAAFAKLQERPNSPFKQYLQDIKPVLAALGQLTGAAFTGLINIIKDPANIKAATDLLQALIPLGDALSGLLQTLTNGNQVKNFIGVLTDIINLVNDLLKNGGIQGLAGVWAFLNGLLSFLNTLLNMPGVGTVLGPIVTALSALAALTFIGKFTGLIDLFGWLMKMAGSSALLSLLTRLPGLGGFMNAAGISFVDTKNPVQQTQNGVPGVWTTKPSKNDPLYQYNKGAKVGDPVMGPGTITGDNVIAMQAQRAARAQAAYETGYAKAMAGKSGGIGGMTGAGAEGAGYAQALRDNAAEEAKYKAMSPAEQAAYGLPYTSQGIRTSEASGKGGLMGLFGPTSLFGRARTRLSSSPIISSRAALGIGGGVGIAGLIASIIGSGVSASAPAGAKGNEQRTLGNFFGAMGGDAAAGAAIGSVVPGIGTLIGGVGGLVAGGVTSKADNGKMVAQNLFDPSAWANGLKQIVGFFKPAADAFTHGGAQIVNFFRPAVQALGHVDTQIADFFKPAVVALGHVDTQIAGYFKGAVGNFAHGGSQIVDFFKGAAANFSHGASQIVDFFKPLTAAFAHGGSQIVDFFKGAAGNFAHGGSQIVDFFKGAAANFSHGGGQIVDFFKGAAANFAHGASQIATFFKPAVAAFAHGGQQIATFFKPAADAFAHGASQIVGFFKIVGGDFAHGAQQIVGFFKAAGGGFSHGAQQIVGFFKTVYGDFAHGAQQIVGFFKTVYGDFVHGAQQIVGFFKIVGADFVHGGQQIVGFFKAAGTAIDTGWKNTVAWFHSVGNAIDTGWKNTVAWFHTVGLAIETFWKNLVSFFHTTWNSLMGALRTTWNFLMSAIHTAWNLLMGVLRSTWNSLVSTFKSVINAIHTAWNTLMAAFRATWNALMAAFRSAWNAAISAFKTVINAIHSTWNSLMAAMRSVWNAAVAAFKAVINAIRTTWNTIVSGFRAVLSTIAAGWAGVTSTFNAVARTILSLWNGVVNVFKSAASAVAGAIGGFLGIGGGGGGGKYGGTIAQALKMAGAPASWASGIATIIQHESGGNPNAINRTDSNARAGHPSQGLMQEIPSTFSRYAGSLASRGITDPLANIYAGIKYIMATYGNINNVPGIRALANGGSYVGYASGGIVSSSMNRKPSSSDTVPAMLTAGEFVLRKSVVDQIGVENLRLLNKGMTGYAQFITGMMNQVRPASPRAYTSGLPTWLQHNPGLNGGGRGSTQTFGNIIINNPVPERASDTLPRTVRKLGYLGPTR